MAGIVQSETSIFIVAAGTHGSALTAANKIVGEIVSWSQNGGERNKEAIQVFGGTVDKISPRSVYELSFDIIVANTYASTLDRWDGYNLGAGTGSVGYYGADNTPTDRAIFISALTGGLWKTWAFNNCTNVTFDKEFAADDFLRGTITFNFTPTTSLGVTNIRSSTASYSTASFTWI